MQTVISESQSIFIQGRQFLEGVLIANEVVDDARKIKKELLLFKFNLEKAFDSVDWKYLETVMFKMNFPTLWQKWIMECVSTASTSILLNGCLTNEFKFQRRLRQAYPLSPFLFLIGVEDLNILMKAVAEAGIFSGYPVGHSKNIFVSHL